MEGIIEKQGEALNKLGTTVKGHEEKITEHEKRLGIPKPVIQKGLQKIKEAEERRKEEEERLARQREYAEWAWKNPWLHM